MLLEKPPSNKEFSSNQQSETDEDLVGAKYEIKKAKKVFQNVRLFYRQGLYKSVIVFDNKETAEIQLPKVQNRIRESSHLETLSDWCPRVAPEMNKENNVEYFVCK